MTYDLDNVLSEGYEGLGPLISDILHTVTPLVAGRFIRDQGRTQGMNITAQLDGGLRFFDFRTLYSKGAHGHDWFCLHGCQSNSPSVEYLKQVRQWLDEHPKEMIVLWLSRHGDVGLNGTDQYTGTTVEERQAYWRAIEGVFEGKLVDSKAGQLNEVTMEEHWGRGEQVVIYATDYAQFTNSSSKAVNAMHIHNELGGSGITSIPQNAASAPSLFSASIRASDKAQNRFYLISMANGGDQIQQAAEIQYVPFIKTAARKACAKLFHIPNFTSWCPVTLMDEALLGNYYNQQTLEKVYTAMETARAAANAGIEFEFPNAIYIDGIDDGGGLRTGTGQICGEGADCSTTMTMPPLSTPHANESYAYAATVIGSNLLRRCAPSSTVCAAPEAAVARLRAARPLQLWDDSEHGRLILRPQAWPKEELQQGLSDSELVDTEVKNYLAHLDANNRTQVSS